MRILGIDPGTIKLGYGVVDEASGNIEMVTCGVLKFSSKVPIEQRLFSIYEQLGELVGRFGPAEVAVEEPFVSENVRSALAIGRAQAIAFIAASSHRLPVFRYTPAQVKQRVTNFGGSAKLQVQEMVRIHLGLAEQPQPDDAADALAVALCHIQETRIKRLLDARRE